MSTAFRIIAARLSGRQSWYRCVAQHGEKFLLVDHSDLENQTAVVLGWYTVDLFVEVRYA